MTHPENHISNYYLLHRLAQRLNEQIIGFKLAQCLALGKNEIVFRFITNGEPLNIKAGFGDESLVYFPGHDIKPGKNVRHIFDEIVGARVSSCRTHAQDRSFRIEFESGHVLVWMLYGKNGNIILFKGHEQSGIFRQQFEKHKEIRLPDFEKYQTPDFEKYADIIQSLGTAKALKQLFPAFSPGMLHYLEVYGIHEKSPEEQWKQIHKLEQLLHTGPIDILETPLASGNSITLNLLPIGDAEGILMTTQDVFEAVNFFANKYLYLRNFQELKQSGLGIINAKIAKAKKQLSSSEETLRHLQSDQNYKNQADVIMANLHAIPAGTEKINLFNFYTEHENEFVFKRGTSPQNHAEKLYRKAKNQEIELRKTQERIIALETELQDLAVELDEIAMMTDWKELKTSAKSIEKQASREALLPYRHFVFEGFDIYVGKSAANNDKLSFGFAHKNDLWLHAQGVSGSHVIIRHKQNQVFPQPVIQKAASIAAYYSKNKGSIMSPVIYTLCKFVRKPKGAAPGAVIAEKEKMVMAEPGIG